MSGYGASAGTTSTSSNSNNNSPTYSEQVQPRRLELSLNPNDGSLQTAPLSTVLLAATHSLYSDLHDMVLGELDVITSTMPDGGAADQPSEPQEQPSKTATIEPPPAAAMILSRKKERMSNLSFAQRRHELAVRLCANGKSLQQVAALTAAAAATTLSQTVQVSTKALQHTRTAWVQADEAQDALYFFHAQLFPGRTAPHDVYGALDLWIHRNWFDLPRDLLLSTGRFESSREYAMSKRETDEQWQLAVREKLIQGEVGWRRRQRLVGQSNKEGQQPLWKVSVKGGIVKFTIGAKALLDDDAHYPIEALLTVFPSERPRWTLLSVTIHCTAKTGEFNHQLETSNRQRYDLHRLAALAMSRAEEDRTVSEEDDDDDDNNNNASSHETTIPAQPLHALSTICHTFLLSWQLEMLSAQAQALRRGVWAAASGSSVTVVPVSFVDTDDTRSGQGKLSILFWKVDDSYGSPSMGDLTPALNDDNSSIHESDSNKSAATHRASERKNIDGTSASLSQQLRLEIRAESNIGIGVSLSGANVLSSSQTTSSSNHTIVKDLLEATSNPFALSASDALLAATKLCAELKCQAAVHALQPPPPVAATADVAATTATAILPPWIRLVVDRGSICVAAKVGYHGIIEKDQSLLSAAAATDFPILFSIMCDARTGSFITTFPRSMHLLRRLATGNPELCEPMSLRVAALPANRRRAAGAESSARAVRDAFDSLGRSMNLLGQRAGVGGTWDNVDDQSSLLRDRSIMTACMDVRAAMMKCCGMAALYGLLPLALGAATGLEAIPDMAGPAIQEIETISLLTAPPISILVDQDLIESSIVTSDGVSNKTSSIDQSLFSVVCSVAEDGLCLYPLELSVTLDSPTAFPQKGACKLTLFKEQQSVDDATGCDDRPAKRAKSSSENATSEGIHSVQDIMEEVEFFAEILSATLEDNDPILIESTVERIEPVTPAEPADTITFMQLEDC